MAVTSVVQSLGIRVHGILSYNLHEHHKHTAILKWTQPVTACANTLAASSLNSLALSPCGSSYHLVGKVNSETFGDHSP